jgi:hypothetical protein
LSNFFFPNLSKIFFKSHIESTSQWEPVEPSHLTPEQVQHFQSFIPVIEEELRAFEEEQSSLQNRRRGLRRSNR